MRCDDDMGGYWEALDSEQSVSDAEARKDAERGVFSGYVLETVREWRRDLGVDESVLDAAEGSAA